MLFAVLMTWGKSTSLNVLLMLALLTIDFRQLLDISVKKSLKLSIRTGIWYGLFFLLFILLFSLIIVGVAYYQS